MSDNSQLSDKNLTHKLGYFRKKKQICKGIEKIASGISKG